MVMQLSQYLNKNTFIFKCKNNFSSISVFGAEIHIFYLLAFPHGFKKKIQNPML